MLMKIREIKNKTKIKLQFRSKRILLKEITMLHKSSPKKRIKIYTSQYQKKNNKTCKLYLID
jgi:hypothetical protein